MEFKKVGIASVLGLLACWVTNAAVSAFADRFGVLGTLVATAVTIQLVTMGTVLAAEKAADLLLEEDY